MLERDLSVDDQPLDVAADVLIERLRALEDRPEPLVVDEQTLRQAVHHGALETKLVDAALELGGSAGGVLGGHRREGGESVGLGTDGFVKPVVDAARLLGSILRAKRLGTWRTVRQYLDIDSSGVHLLHADVG